MKLLTVAVLLTLSGFARPATGQEAAEPTVAITVGDPILVAQAPADLNRGGPGWGRWQFPMISRLADGRLLVTFTLEPDSYASYGKPVGCAFSADEGATWRVGKPQARSALDEGVLLPNGDRLKAVELTSLRAEDYELPQPVCNFVCSYRYPRSLYRVDKLPREVRGWRFSRRAKESDEWVDESATVKIPDELLHVTAEDTRGQTPSVGTTDAVIAGPLARPHLWGKIRMAPDRSIWGVTYLWRMQGDRPRYAPVFLRSTDHGRTWAMVGEIGYTSNRGNDRHADARDGFTEPDYNFRRDGSLICVMRTMDGNGHGPLFLTGSADNARTWTKPTVLDTFGKWPQLLTLGDGTTLASYGASGGPGYHVVRATVDPQGQVWEPPVRTRVSPLARGTYDTCGHTEMVALDDHTALLVYSDFNYPDADGVPRKSILVRRMQVAANAALP